MAMAMLNKDRRLVAAGAVGVSAAILVLRRPSHLHAQ